MRRYILSTASQARLFHASAKLSQFHFDTQQLVASLEQHGLTHEQAVGVMSALEGVVRESVSTMVANLVTRAEQEKHQYTQKVDFAKLKSEVSLVEKQDYSFLKAENERLLSEVEKLKQRLREEVNRTAAGVRLDLNLERGRMRDELTQRELKLREVDTRIETELSTIRASMESQKFTVLCVVQNLQLQGVELTSVKHSGNVRIIHMLSQLCSWRLRTDVFGTLTGAGALILDFAMYLRNLCIIHNFVHKGYAAQLLRKPSLCINGSTERSIQ